MSNTIAKRPSFSMMVNTPKFQEAINNTIKDPDHQRRFVSAIVSTVAVNPALQECTPHTILSGALLGESLNLSPSPQLGQYYLVPFNQKEKKDKNGNIIPACTNATFQIGYKGLVQLAIRSGQYKCLTVISVKEGELVGWNPMTEKCTVNIIEDDDEREKLPTIGYLAHFETISGFTKTMYWSKSKMINHADRYSQAFSKEAVKGKFTKVSFSDYEAKNYPAGDEWKYSSFWYKDFDAMAHKTMLRQIISKWGPTSIETQQLETAMVMDDAVIEMSENDYGETEFAKAEEGDLDVVAEVNPETAAQEEGQVNLSDV